MFIRSKLNPILKPSPTIAWQALKVYNTTAIYENNIYKIFFRAVGSDGISCLGFGESNDGENFILSKQPVMDPSLPSETFGVEDPRLTKINDRYFLTYTGYDGKSARLHLATSFDLKIWQKHGQMLQGWNFMAADGFIVDWDMAQQSLVARHDWCKAGGIFNEKINDEYAMLFGDRHIWMAFSRDGLKWQAVNKPFIKPRPGYFDSIHVEMGPAPIMTEKGWLIIYHGIDEKIIYRLGIILLDINDPKKILYRSDKPIFEPQADYEITGIIDLDKTDKPKVVFCNGATIVDGILRIFYGASDTFICTATAPLEDILKNNV
jgi:predicted GH43/DUF377 family glycosyl hydrolase